MPEINASIRALVRRRALDRCEYCGIPESLTFAEHEVDHIIAIKHGGSSDAGNLALSCTLCNRYKGSDIASVDPLTGKIEALYHPRLHTWNEHFLFDLGRIIGLTPAGRTTSRLLQFNRPERVGERTAADPPQFPSTTNPAQ